MYENPEIMRQLVNERLDEGRALAANRRLADRARRENRRGLRARLTYWFTPGRRTTSVPKPATA